MKMITSQPSQRNQKGRRKNKILIILEILAIYFVSVVFRGIVSLYSYSGQGTPPMYGDYEAQRHWQEITTNLPIEDWYKNTTNNDLQYWGLDYPPLTAYHSYYLGKLAKRLNHSFVELHKSRGIESPQHKSFMRRSVLMIDVLIYMPSMLYLATTLVKKFEKPNLLLATVFVCLSFPGQILIDNGHFQYNNFSLAFAALAIVAILKTHYCLAAFLFTLALNYKQMELYHALTFFAFLLRKCNFEKGFSIGLVKFISLGLVVIGTMAVIWSPWLTSWESMTNVLKRLFPIGRGIFEDKVANFWCAFNVICKLKSRFTNEKLALLSLGVTAFATIPINIYVFLKSTNRNFIFGLCGTSMAFFLFSYQVHEKSILLVCLPAICLFPLSPHYILWFLEVATFSMFPLLLKDNLIVPFSISLILFHAVVKMMLYHYNVETKIETKLQKIFTLSIENTILMVTIVVLSIYGPSIERYPYLWPLINSLFSCFHFGIFYLKVIYNLVDNQEDEQMIKESDKKVN